MRVLCRGELWLSDVSNNNIIYRAMFVSNDKEMYDKMIEESEKKKYNTVMAALDRDDPYEFVDIMEGKTVLPHYIKLLELFSSEENSTVQGYSNNFECARRIIEYLESISTDSDIFRIIVEKMWPEFSFFSDAMSCVSIERCSKFYNISEIKSLEENYSELKNSGLDKIPSYQNDAINNMKVLSLIRKVSKINHPTEEETDSLKQEESEPALTKKKIPPKQKIK